MHRERVKKATLENNAYYYLVSVLMILVDPIREYDSGPRGWRLWCHMATDDLSNEGFEELHAMAERLGLPRRAFQRHPRHPHYDLPPDKRALAVELGAVEVTSKELVRRCSLPKVDE